jgi:hypothetical protein
MERCCKQGNKYRKGKLVIYLMLHVPKSKSEEKMLKGFVSSSVTMLTKIDLIAMICLKFPLNQFLYEINICIRNCHQISNSFEASTANLMNIRM